MKKLFFLSSFLMTCSCMQAGDVVKLNTTTAEVRLDNGQRMYLDFYGPNIFRLFLDPQGGILRDPQAVPPAQILVDQPRKAVSLKVEGSRVTTDKLQLDVDAATGALTVNGMSISAPDFQKGKTSITLSQKSDEYFYGGGVQNGRFSHRGKVIAIENTNNWVDGGVASPQPYFWSTGGYGVMGYTFAPGKYDFGATEPGKTVLMHETGYLDYFFMFNQGTVPLLNDYYQLTGNPVLLPKFGFYEGHLNAYNRDYWTPAENGFMAYEDGKRYNESQKDNGGIRESLNGELPGNYQFSARAAIDRYLDNDMPLGWFLPNDGYGAGYGQTETLDGNIQNLKEFGEYARSKGVEIGLWTQSDLHPKEGIEALLQRDIVKEVRDAGVRVLKTDVAWVGAGYSFGLNGVADVAHIMPYYGNDARPFIISLDGWAGTQRYAGIWTGDQTGGEWEYIRFHIPTYIGSGLSGQPNISSDMDGIFGGNNLPVNIRDFQWKTFTPMQLNMDGWGRNPKYPQALGEPATTINRWYLKLKSRLMPYTYSIAREAVDGLPMIRAMFLDEANPYTLGTATRYQFLYGPDILVAPIFQETRADKDGNDVRDGIYLPKGEWVDYFTGEVYQGGRIINDFDAPIWKLPILVRRGAIIPMHKSTNNPSETDAHLRRYDIYPSGKTAFTEYDDDGTTQAYLSGASVTTRVESDLTDKGQLQVTLHPSKGSYEGYEPNKFSQLRINLSQKPRKVTYKLNGKKVELKEMDSYFHCITTANSFYYGKGNTEYVAAPALFVNLRQTNVATAEQVVQVEGAVVDNTDQLAKSHGPLAAPASKGVRTAPRSLAPQWSLPEGADYAEVEFQGLVFSTIRHGELAFEDLVPETEYSFRLRSVNADGRSEWSAPITARTEADPLEFAIRGMRGEATIADQPGQGTRNLFDFDESKGWHTSWNAPRATPFDLVVDMRSVNQLDKLQYVPRPDAGNGTLLKGTISYSMDRQNWTTVTDFDWARSGDVKEVIVPGRPTARYVKFAVSESVGGFGSGSELYIFRVPGSEYYIPGDINQDGRIDENDLTSYMNYTGLRQGDGDFEGYVSKGDLNQNGLIDAYDISAVAIELETGVSSRKVPTVQGAVSVTADKAQYEAGDELKVTLAGKGLVSVNAISLCLPYDPADLEFLGVEAPALEQMYNMTYDRLHTNGQKALYPTFVNLGEQKYLEGDTDIMTLRFRAKRKLKFGLKVSDGMLVDKYQNVVAF